MRQPLSPDSIELLYRLSTKREFAGMMPSYNHYQPPDPSFPTSYFNTQYQNMFHPSHYPPPFPPTPFGVYPQPQATFGVTNAHYGSQRPAIFQENGLKLPRVSTTRVSDPRPLHTSAKLAQKDHDLALGNLESSTRDRRFRESSTGSAKLDIKIRRSESIDAACIHCIRDAKVYVDAIAFNAHICDVWIRIACNWC